MTGIKDEWPRRSGQRDGLDLLVGLLIRVLKRASTAAAVQNAYDGQRAGKKTELGKLEKVGPEQHSVPLELVSFPKILQ